MKDFIAKLKSAGFKQLAIDHAEKAVAFVIAALLVFSLIGTNWKGYGKTPESLTQKVQSAKSSIDRGDWSNSADATNGLYTPAAGLQEEQVVQLLTNDPEQHKEIVENRINYYKYMTSLVPPLYRNLEPAQQPEPLAVEDMIADHGYATIPQMTVTAMTDQPADDKGDTDDDENRRQVRNGANGGPGAIPGGPGDPAFAGPGRELDPMGAGMGPGMGPSLTKSRGVRYVAVRGIVPLSRQIERIAEALNVTHLQATALVDYWDFHLERRSKPLRGGHDFGKWEKVDIRTAMDVLRDAAGWDPELVELSLTDPVLTMALPMRKLYEWHKMEVSHPKIDKHVLTPSERDRQMEIYERYLDQQIEEAGALKEQQKGGLSALQGGGRNFGQQMGMQPGGGMRSQTTQRFVDRIAQGLDRDNPERVRQELLDTIMKNQTASGFLLLFRYIDFDVKPGMTYQYRVQLKLANPNYERPEHLVLDPEFTKERFLTTPFSQPTAPVTVPPAINYYVTKVDEENGANPPSATFDVYQWSTEFGSTINQKLKILFGSFVGDRTETEVVDVAHDTYSEEREVDFKSDDVLVDIVDAPKPIDVDEHPDLKAALSRDTLRRGLGVAEQALVANEFGELVTYDPVSMAAAHARSVKKYKLDKDDRQHIIDANTESADPMGGIFADAEAAYGPGGADPNAGRTRGRRGRGGDGLRRRGSGRGSRRGASPMPGIGAGPGT